MVALREVEVVRSLKAHLQLHGLGGTPVSDIVVDADGSYQNVKWASELEPMAAVRIGVYRPDVLCIVHSARGQFVVAFEVKADLSLWQKGITQARGYQKGVHYSYLALPRAGAEHHRSELEELARDGGVGVLYMAGAEWQEKLRPSNPRPLPWELESTATALRGLPAVRQLQLNHPINYLAAVFLRAELPALSPLEALRAAWPGLRKDSSRMMAIKGAQALGLLDAGGGLTVEGATTADLLREVGFRPDEKTPRRKRLAEIRPGVGAVARSVFLRSPAARLIIDTLADVPNRALSTVDLFSRARERNRTLTDALLLSDPSRDVTFPPSPGMFSPSAPHSLRQGLWHAGLLAHSLHASAGKSAETYQPEKDVWELDATLVARLRG